MEDELTARVLAHGPLTALIGTRFNWGQRVQTEPLPALTALLVSPGRGYVHAGPDQTANPRIQFDCYGRTSLEARTVGRTLRDMLETPATQGTVRFSVALLDSERGPLIEDVGGGLKVHRYSLDFFVWFSTAA